MCVSEMRTCQISYRRKIVNTRERKYVMTKEIIL